VLTWRTDDAIARLETRSVGGCTTIDFCSQIRLFPTSRGDDETGLVVSRRKIR
jgi:hypothetical protein